MALEALLDSNSQFSLPMTVPVSGAGRILGQDASVAVANLGPPTSAYSHSYRNPDTAMRYSGNNPGNVFSTDDTFTPLCQGIQNERRKEQLEYTTDSPGLCKSTQKTCQDSLPIRIKKEPDAFIPTPKKPRLDVNQENTQQQQSIQEFLLKELQDYNTQLRAMVMQHRQQNLLQQSILHSPPQVGGFHEQLQEGQIRLLQDHSDEQGTYVSLLDGGLCSKLMQYLHDFQRNTHDNDMTRWNKFVSTYYAPGSKRRWCFSTYENIQLQAPGVFCHKSMERWCCDLCGSTSGKGLDLPRASKTPSGFVLEYEKAVQESVYQHFHVVHEGILRISSGHDLKILSWEFCAHKHEEYLSRRLITPQIKHMIQAAKNYQNNIQNGVSGRLSSEDLWANSNMLALAGNQLKRSMELPLVNELGYPKRFIRCLQIAEIFHSMEDLMTSSWDMEMGPIETLNKCCQASQIDKQLGAECRTEQFINASSLPPSPAQSDSVYCTNGCRLSEMGAMTGSENAGLATGSLNNQVLSQDSPTVPLRRKLHNSVPELVAQSFEVDTLIHEMPVACSRGKNEGIHQTKHESSSSSVIRHGERSGAASVADAKRAAASLPNGPSSCQVHKVTIKVEPHSPEQLQAPFQGSASGLYNIQDFDW